MADYKMNNGSMTYVKLDPCSTRLGNWMFQYAAAKCAAPNEPVTFVISGDQDIDAVRKYACLWPDAQYVREAPQGASVRVGLFQDSKYVDRALSRQLFLDPLKVAFEHSAPPNFELQTLNFELANLVSIHVRRGDYLSLPHRHPFVGEKYLREAVARFPNSEFLVFSDDIPWCKRFFTSSTFKHSNIEHQTLNFKPGTLNFYFSECNSVLTDLYLMTQCKGGHICSNSTFSWWGAFLGEGKTIFPSVWYGPAIKDENWQGLYFGGSEVIENNYSLGMWLKARACMTKNACGNLLRKVGLK